MPSDKRRMTDSEKISVIIVNFNSGPFLSELVRHLGQFDYSFDLIVVDNASVDNSADFCASEETVRFIRLSENIGFGAACNRGATLAVGDLLVFLNPDCFPDPNAFALIQESFSRGARIGACGGLLLGFDGREQLGSRRHDPTFIRCVGKAVRQATGLSWAPTFDRIDEPLPGHPCEIDAVSGACLAVRRDIFEEVGGFDESFFLHFEDLDLCRVIRGKGYEVRFVPKAIFYHYQGASDGVSDRGLRHHKVRSLARYLGKHARAPKPLENVFALLLSILLSISSPLFSRGFREARPTREQIRAIVNVLSGRTKCLLLLGARSDVGEALLARFAGAAKTAVGVSRRPSEMRDHRGVVNVHPDFIKRNVIPSTLRFEAVVALCPIWELSAYSEVLKDSKEGPVSLIALSSTSIITKAASAEANQNSVAQKLREGEEWILERLKNQIDVISIVRPTLIYGGRWNRNVNLIKAIIQKIKIGLNLSFALGLRNPVHADDLADWIFTVLNREVDDLGQAAAVVEIQGGELLSFNEFMLRCAGSVGHESRRISIGQHWLARLIVFLRRLPKFAEIPEDFVARLAQDFDFDDEAASELAVVQKRRFRP